MNYELRTSCFSVIKINFDQIILGKKPIRHQQREDHWLVYKLKESSIINLGLALQIFFLPGSFVFWIIFPFTKLKDKFFPHCKHKNNFRYFLLVFRKIYKALNYIIYL